MSVSGQAVYDLPRGSSSVLAMDGLEAGMCAAADANGNLPAARSCTSFAIHLPKEAHRWRY